MVGDRAGGGTDVLRGWADQAARPHLLEDVGRPAGHPRAREESGEERRRDVRDVEDDRGPELHVRRQHAVGMTRGELRERGLLERFRDLDARRLELACRPAQDARPGSSAR